MNNRQLTARYLLGFLLLMAVSASGSASQPAVQTSVLTIQNRQLQGSMNVIRVKQGDTVTLRWKTDEPLTLHLHGYDIEKEVRPGTITELSFNAYASGRFPINIHSSGEHADEPADESTLVYLEVYPR